MGKADSRGFQELSRTRKNDYLTIDDRITLSSDLNQAINHGDVLVIAIASQQLRNLARQLNEFDLQGKTIVLCMKGLEEETGKRLTQIIKEEILSPCEVAIWVGPGHVQDYLAGIPNCMVIGSDNINTTKMLVQEFASDQFVFIMDKIQLVMKLEQLLKM